MLKKSFEEIIRKREKKALEKFQKSFSKHKKGVEVP
jgi:hypothetical protein